MLCYPDKAHFPGVPVIARSVLCDEAISFSDKEIASLRSQ